MTKMADSSQSNTIALLDGGDKKMTGVTTEFIAKCIGAIITTFNGSTKNQRVRLAEVEYTGNGLATSLESVTGQSWIALNKSTEVFLNEAMKAGEKGDVKGFYLGHIIKLNFDGKGAGYFEEGMKWFHGAVERQSLQEIVRKSISHLKC